MHAQHSRRTSACPAAQEHTCIPNTTYLYLQHPRSIPASPAPQKHTCIPRNPGAHLHPTTYTCIPSTSRAHLYPQHLRNTPAFQQPKSTTVSQHLRSTPVSPAPKEHTYNLSTREAEVRDGRVTRACWLAILALLVSSRFSESPSLKNQSRK